MKLPLLNKIAATGLIAIVVCAVISMIVTITGQNNSITAMPIRYTVMIEACCWAAILIAGCIVYFVLKKHVKARK